MAAPNSQATTSDQATAIQSIWTQIAQLLESRKHQLDEEIKHYPPPITACDRQFDYLLEQRRIVSRELEQLPTMVHKSSVHSEACTIVDRFLNESTSLDDQAKRRIRAELNEQQLKREP